MIQASNKATIGLQQFHELAEHCAQLQAQNQSLKKSLQDLINVNNELTQSIGELQTHKTKENEKLYQQLKSLQQDNESLRRNQTDSQNLVAVIEQLIQSFKDMQLKYENQLEKMKEQWVDHKKYCQSNILRLEDNCQMKLKMVQDVVGELKMQDDSVEKIQNKLNALITNNKTNGESSASREIQEKNKIINTYINIISHVKSKLMEKID